MPEELFILSDAAAREFENQDVFSTVNEFIDAMPPATRAVHLYPITVDMLAEMDQNGMEIRNKSELQDAGILAGDEDLFSWLTWTHTTPDRAPPTIEDESIFRVDDANDLLKEQEGEFQESGVVQDMKDVVGPAVPTEGINYMRDEGTQEMRPMPPDWEGIPSYFHGTPPGDFSEYERDNYYRVFEDESGEYDHRHDLMSFLAAEHMLLRQPATLPVSVVVESSRPITPVHGPDGRVACLVPGEARTRIAAQWGDIVRNLNPEVVAAAEGCQVKMKKADPRNKRWTFSVHDPNGSGKSHVVHLKVVPRGNTSDLTKLDLKVGCSCGFWKWQGPDYHAATDGYLDQKKRSDGSAPNVKDPKGINRICKHVYAASSLFLSYRLQRRKKSSRQRIASMNTGHGRVNVVAYTPSEALNLRKLSILSDETNTPQGDLARKIAEVARKIHT